MKELNGAKCYTPNTRFEDTQKHSQRLWDAIMKDNICGENPTLQQIAIHNLNHFAQQRNFGAKTMIELQEILKIAGLEISNETPIFTII